MTRLMNVYLTVDTEIWCDGWNNIDAKFPAAFKKYIYGETNSGNYGLPFQLKLLKEYNLKAVFFVEPLFASRFGIQPLQEIVQLIQEYGQSVELHLHTEWADESKQTIFPHIKEKREHIKYFSQAEQSDLIALGKDLLKQAGCANINAFRAGTFGANNDTLVAIENNKIAIDSSYNICMHQCEIKVFDDIQQPIKYAGIVEAPMSTFKDGAGQRRHVQLTACSYSELRNSMQQAQEYQWNDFVLLSHSSELLNSACDKQDKVVTKRFEKLCAFLANNTDRFKTSHFEELQVNSNGSQVKSLSLGLLPTIQRYYEQSLRRIN